MLCDKQQACSVIQSRPALCNPWPIARPAPLSMEFSKQEYWSGLPFRFSRRSSRPRDWTCISCTGRRILYRKPPGRFLWRGYRLVKNFATRVHKKKDKESLLKKVMNRNMTSAFTTMHDHLQQLLFSQQEKKTQGFPWWSSSWDSMLSPPGSRFNPWSGN